MEKFKSVNEQGLKEIERVLNRYHKLVKAHGEGYFSYAQLCAWADSVDFQLSEGNAPVLEIPACESVTGTTIRHVLPAGFIDEGDDTE